MESCTNILRFIKRDLKPADVYNGRGFKYVLQQLWYVLDSPEADPREEWRDVPLVEEG